MRRRAIPLPYERDAQDQIHSRAEMIVTPSVRTRASATASNVGLRRQDRRGFGSFGIP